MQISISCSTISFPNPLRHLQARPIHQSNMLHNPQRHSPPQNLPTLADPPLKGRSSVEAYPPQCIVSPCFSSTPLSFVNDKQCYHTMPQDTSIHPHATVTDVSPDSNPSLLFIPKITATAHDNPLSPMQLALMQLLPYLIESITSPLA